MPSGRVHETINVTALLLGCGAAALLPDSWRPDWAQLETGTGLAFAAGYLLGTFLITPDLDLADGHVNAKRNWGLLGGLWIPYGKLSRHRGISHSWITGPVTRALYLAVLIGGLVWVARGAGYDLWPGWHNSLIALGAGYLISQWLHLLADGIMPWHALFTAPRSAQRKNRPKRGSKRHASQRHPTRHDREWK